MIAQTPPADPLRMVPPRRPGSLRRTSTIDTHWPDGFEDPMHMHGHARDLFTPANGAPRILAEDRVEIVASFGREILSIRASRCDEEIQQLAGLRAAGKFRGMMARLVPEVAGSPLGVLLDDFPGASLVANWAWENFEPEMRKAVLLAADTGGGAGSVVNVCMGFRAGASSLAADGRSSRFSRNKARVPPLADPADPSGWHAIAPQQGIGMRRARRMDIWPDGPLVRMDIGFQDSGTAPDGGERLAVHEYRLLAAADRETLELCEASVDPRVLPYGDCLDAAATPQALLGVSLAQLRRAVPATLSGPAGCTHLNDMLRSMADVPQMLTILHREEQA